MWNTLTSKPEGVLSNSGKWGQVTFLAWIFIDKPIDNKRVALAVGTGRGNLTLCPFVHGHPVFQHICSIRHLELTVLRQTMAQSRTFNAFQFNDPVEAMSFDRTNCRLAASSHSGPVKVFNVDSNCGSQHFTPMIMLTLEQWVYICFGLTKWRARFLEPFFSMAPTIPSS